jgi:hypothetical protein
MQRTMRNGAYWILIAVSAVFAANGAYADNLKVSADAPAWAHFGAAALLWLHIGGGAIGILSGAAAIAARKGAQLHRAAGTVFFAAMAVCYAVGAGVAPFLDEGQRTNFVAGIMALYLLLSGWRAVRQPQATAGPFEIMGLVFALAITTAGLVFMHMGANDPSGTVDGSPPQAFVLFTVAGLFSAAGEIHVLVRRTLAPVSRIARHLWRMCFSLFIATGSFFLGQMQVFPQWLQDTPVLYVLALAPIAALLFWLVRVRFRGWAGRPAPQQTT